MMGLRNLAIGVSGIFLGGIYLASHYYRYMYMRADQQRKAEARKILASNPDNAIRKVREIKNNLLITLQYQLSDDEREYIKKQTIDLLMMFEGELCKLVDQEKMDISDRIPSDDMDEDREEEYILMEPVLTKRQEQIKEMRILLNDFIDIYNQLNV